MSNMGKLKTVANWFSILFILSVIAATLGAAGFIVLDSPQSTPTGNDTMPSAENMSYTLPADYEDEPPMKVDPQDPGHTTVTLKYEQSTIKLNTSLIEKHLYKEIDAYRRKHNSTPLNHSERLESVARAHSADMGRDNYFRHTTNQEKHESSSGRWDKVSNECSKDVRENIVLLSFPRTTVEDMSGGNKSIEERLADKMVRLWHLSNEGHQYTLQTNAPEYYGVGVYMDTETPATSDLIRGNMSGPTYLRVFGTMNTCGGENPDWDYAANKTKVTEGYGENQTETSNPSDSSKSGSLSVWSP